MSELISVTVNDGKYTVRQIAPGKWECLCYGEAWTAKVDGPNNLEVALAYEVDRLRKLVPEELLKHEAAPLESDADGHRLDAAHGSTLLSDIGTPKVSIKPMKLSDGRTDFYVEIRVGDRVVYPHVFRDGEYKAAYHVALYNWLLNGKPKPRVIEFGEGDFPAQAYSVTGDVERLRAILRRWQAYGCPDCGGDCGSANPPVICCIMQETRSILEASR